jgi:TusA-related sulfurtransferase
MGKTHKPTYCRLQYLEKSKMAFAKAGHAVMDFTVKILLEKHRELNMETNIAFVDRYIYKIKKNFDRVNRTKLLEILQNDNILQHIIHNICNLYKTNLISVKTEDRKSEWKVIDSGVRQGCRLLPILFIIYMNAIIKEWRQKPHWYIPIGRNLVRCHTVCS